MPRTFIILNPAARSKWAAKSYQTIKKWADAETTVHITSAPGEARIVARQAVEEGYEIVVAAGGDGTVNEVVNGISGSQASLGVLPLGTMNVFAAEIGLPRSLKKCWEIIKSGCTKQINLPEANGHIFVQMAGVGFDAHILKETDWKWKCTFGPLSYLIPAIQVAARTPPLLSIRANGVCKEGAFVLVGNGRYYGGLFPVFPGARIDQALLNVLVFKNIGFFDILRYLNGVLWGTHTKMRDIDYFQTTQLTVSSNDDVPVEVDGEVIGALPVTFQYHAQKLRVLAPPERIRNS